MSSILGAVGGLFGNAFASGDQSTDTASQQQALNAILGVQAPTLSQEEVTLGKENVAGQLNPALQATQQMGPSAYGNISTNPQLMQAQMNALTQLQQLGQGGMTAQEKAALMSNLTASNQAANAQSQAVMQNMAARGMGGGGAELAAELGAGQNAANSNAMQSLNIQGQAQQNALQALAQSGQLGQSMQAQQFGQQAQAAAAQNAINQFNTQNRQAVMGQNAASQNQAQQWNLANAQNIANQNTAIGNQNQLYNSQQVSNNFNQQAGLAGMKASAYGNYGNYYGQQAANTRGMWSGVGAGVGTALGGMDFSQMMGKGGGSSNNGWAAGDVAAPTNYGYAIGPAAPLPDTPPPSAVNGNLGPGFAHGGKIPMAQELEQGHKQIPVPMNKGGFVNSVVGSYADGGQVPDDDSPKIDQTKAKEFEKGFNSGSISLDQAMKNLKEGLGMAKGGKVEEKPKYVTGGVLNQPTDSSNAVSDYKYPGTDNYDLKRSLPPEDPSRAHLLRAAVPEMNKGGSIPDYGSNHHEDVTRHSPDQIERLINELSMLRLAKGGYIAPGQTPAFYPHYESLPQGSPNHGGMSSQGVSQPLSPIAGELTQDFDNRIPVPMYYGGKVYPAAPQSYSQGGYVTHDQTPASYPHYEQQPMGVYHGGAGSIPVNQQPPLSPMAKELSQRPDDRIPVPMNKGGFVTEGQTPYSYPRYETLPQTSNHGGMAQIPVNQQPPLSPLAKELTQDFDNRIPVTMSHGGSIEMRGRGQAKSHMDSMPPMGSINMDAGGMVPGQAAVAGDSVKNDMVPAYLSPGEVVVPRSVVNSGDRNKMANAVQYAKPANTGLRKLHALMEMKALHPKATKPPKPLK